MECRPEIELPERSQAPLGSRKPQATLVFGRGSARSSWRVALPVGRKLKKASDAGDLDVLTPDELVELVRKLEAEAAFAKLLSLVDRRDYSRKELEQRLAREGYPAPCIANCLTRACEASLVDDQRFAEVFVRSKLSAGWGARRIERELRFRGVEPNDLAGWPDDYLGEESECERAYEIASARRLPAKNPYPKTVRFLMARGFASGVCADVARRLCDEARERDEEAY